MKHERRTGGRPDWQLKQAAEAVALFLRQVVVRRQTDLRRVVALLHGNAAPVVEELGPSCVEEDAPEWYQAMQRELGVHHYALRTEAAYLDWLKRYVQFHGGRDPRQMGTREVKAYLEHLAIERNVAPSTQNQAFSALLFAYTKVYEKELVDLSQTAWAKGDKRLPVVLSAEEVEGVLGHMDAVPRSVARLLWAELAYWKRCV